jgi:hypothetical protein
MKKKILPEVKEDQAFQTHGDFGSPDASRVDARNEYLVIPGATPPVGNATGLLKERVVIGKKGAGKTIYMRALQTQIDSEQKQNKNSTPWMLIKEKFDLPTMDVISVARLSNDANIKLMKHNISFDAKNQTTELWSKLWENAFIAFLYVTIFNESMYKKYNISDHIDHHIDLLGKKNSVEKFFNDLPKSDSPISMIKFFLSKKGHSQTSFRNYVYSANWDVLYSLVDGLINNLPQMAFFLDALDDSFDEAPDSWISCQEGLFKSVFRILNRSDQFSNRFHVIIALREIILSSLLNSEHSNRFLTDPHVRYISWDTRSARYFLVEKIKRLAVSGYKVHDVDIDPVRYPMEHWLGIEKIENVERNINEPAIDYLLRHTRLLPRDIVIMGNGLCNSRIDRLHRGTEFSQGKFRQVVHKIARQICMEAVKSTANEYLSSMDYVAEVLLRKEKNLKTEKKMINTDENFNQNEVISEIYGFIEEKINSFIQFIGKETFSYQNLIDSVEASDLSKGTDIFSYRSGKFFSFENIFYRHGMLSYMSLDGGVRRWRFSWQGIPSIDNSVLPVDAPLYGFHSSVLDAYKGIELSEFGPVF